MTSKDEINVPIALSAFRDKKVILTLKTFIWLDHLVYLKRRISAGRSSGQSFVTQLGQPLSVGTAGDVCVCVCVFWPGGQWRI